MHIGRNGCATKENGRPGFRRGARFEITFSLVGELELKRGSDLEQALRQEK